MDDRTMTIVLGVIGSDCHAVGKADPAEVRQKFLDMGFDRVVFPDDDLREEALKADILARRKG